MIRLRRATRYAEIGAPPPVSNARSFLRVLQGFPDVWHEAVPEGTKAELASTQELKVGLEVPKFSEGTRALMALVRSLLNKPAATKRPKASGVGRLKISEPFNMTHKVHVNFNAETGFQVLFLLPVLMFCSLPCFRGCPTTGITCSKAPAFQRTRSPRRTRACSRA